MALSGSGRWLVGVVGVLLVVAALYTASAVGAAHPASRASNAFCHRSAAVGPGIHEPRVTPGPTEVVSGFYLTGGPLARFSAPNCKRPHPRPGAGTVEVVDMAGLVVARQTSAPGHFVKIPLPAGAYTVRGTFLNATVNEAHPTETEPVVIPAGDTVRRDFILSIP
jgi:hypothetical protein